MNKNDFYQLCQESKLQEGNVLSQRVLPLVRDYLVRQGSAKLPVIWLETNDSGDNNIAFMNTAYPYLEYVFRDMIDLLYSNTFMAAQGSDALAILHQVASFYEGEFILVVEGAIPAKDNGIYNIIAQNASSRLTALEAVT